MKSDNLIQISGYLPKDAVTNDKRTFASFTIGHKSGNETMFFNCVVFSKETAIPFDLLKSGMEIFVKGHLRPNTYTKDGMTHKGIRIVADKIRSTKE